MAIKNAFRIPLKEKFTTAGHSFFNSLLIPDGKIYCLQQIAWEIDKTTSGGRGRCRLLIGGHGYLHYLKEQADPTATALYTYNEKVWLVPGETLVLEIDHAAQNTVAQMWLTGYSTDFKEGVV